MRKIHIILATVYGMIWVSSVIFVLANLQYVTPNRLVHFLFNEAIGLPLVAMVVVNYLLRILDKDNALLAGWYSVVLPTLLGVVVGIIIEMNLMNSRLYDPTSRHIPITYLAIAVCSAALPPLSWHTAAVRRYRDALKPKSGICT